MKNSYDRFLDTASIRHKTKRPPRNHITSHGEGKK